MALAALLYIYRVTDTTSIATVTPEYIEDGRAHVLQDKHVPSYVTILRIHGPLLSVAGAAAKASATVFSGRRGVQRKSIRSNRRNVFSLRVLKAA
jgi:hypothetical protein